MKPAQVTEVLAWLERRGSPRVATGMARFGITTRDRIVGISVGVLRKYAKQLGRDHGLGLALWDTGCYEARLLAAWVAEPQRMTKRQMQSWAGEFDNWATCDHACFHLFDRTPHAWDKAREWVRSPREFVKRAGFALMASLAGHDKTATDAQFLALLPLIERGASDERNFVKKGVSWALRSLKRRGPKVRAAARALAQRLAKSDDPTERWVGKDGLRDL